MRARQIVALLLSGACTLLVASTHSGCGPALTIGGLVGLGLLGDDDSKTTDTPPAVSVTTPSGVVNDIVEIRYRLTDPDLNDRAGVRVEYQVGNGAFAAAEQAFLEGAEGTKNLSAPPAGAEHGFLWNTANDLGFQETAQVVVRVTPFDSGDAALAGNPAQTLPFTVFNQYMTTLAKRSAKVGLQPTGLAIGSDRSVLLADTPGGRIARIDPTGTLGFLAGTGVNGFNGSGTPGTDSQLNLPFSAVAVKGSSQADDVLIADTFNGLIRRVDGSNGFLVESAGQGGETGELILARDAAVSPRDVAGDANGNLYLLEDRRVRVVHRQGSTPFTLPTGPGTCSQLTQLGTTVSPGQIFTVLSLFPSCGTNTAGNTYTVPALQEAVALAVDGAPGNGLRLYVLELGPAGGEVSVGALGNASTFPRLLVVNLDAAAITIQTPAGALTIPPGEVRPALAGSALLPLSSLSDLALFATDVLLLTTGRDNRVHAVNLSNSARTIAGTSVPPGSLTGVAGVAGFGGLGGDGGPPLQAEFLGPLGVAADPAGNVFVADANGRLRVLAAQSVAYGSQTVAAGTVGSLSLVPSGTEGAVVAPQAPSLTPSGDLLLADTELADPRSNRILQISSNDASVTTLIGSGVFGDSGDGGPATDARLGAAFQGVSSPDGQLVLFADVLQHRVRAANVSGASVTFLGVSIAPGAIQTVVGTGVATGTGAALGDGGPARLASLNQPSVVSFDQRGLLWVSDTSNQRLRACNPGLSLVRVAGVDVAPGQIQTVVGTGAVGTSSSDGDGGPASAALLNSAAAFVEGDVLYVLDGLDFLNTVAPEPRVRAVNLGAQTLTLGGVTIAPGSINTVIGSGLARLDQDTNLGDGGPALSATFRGPGGLAARADGLVFVTDGDDHRIRVANLGPSSVLLGGRTLLPGTIETIVGTGVPSFAGDPSVAAAGFFGASAGDPINGPRGALLLSDGERLLFGDEDNGALRMVNLGQQTRSFAGISANPGQVVVIAGSRSGRGRAASPFDVRIDSNGVVLFTDRGTLDDQPALFQLDPRTRLITLVAGNLERTVSDGSNLGDGGSALLATLNQPNGLDLDAEGSIYLADSANRRVRFINRASASRQPVTNGPNVAPGAIATLLGGAGDGDANNDDGLALNDPALDVFFPTSVSTTQGALWVVDGQARLMRADTNTGSIAGIMTQLAVLSSTTATPLTANQLNDAGVNFQTSGVRVGDVVRLVAAGGALVVNGAAQALPFETQVTQVVDADTLGVGANLTGTVLPITYQVLRRDTPTAVAGINATDAYLAFFSRQLFGGWVARVSWNGSAFTFVTVLGTSTPGWNGDRLAATDMQISTVPGMYLDGNLLFVSDASLNRVLAVDVAGQTHTVAGLTIGPNEARTVAGGGQGFGGFNGDAVPPQVALLNFPTGVAAGPNGGLFVVDNGNGRLRRFQR